MRNYLHLLILLFITTLITGQTLQTNASHEITPSYFLNKLIVTDSIAPDSTEMGSLNSVEFASHFGRGWNIGNSLEAIGGETAWGNPMVTQQLIDSVKAAGFNSIRIPVAWSKFSDTTTYAITANWLARVEEVVNFALNDSMYVILNEHWDGGWMQPTYSQQSYVNNRLAAMWRQIAVRFRDYNDHLLFAGSNEVMVDGDYGAPTVEYYTVQNGFNQLFVNTIRSTGGRNAYRYLVVQGFNTNIDYTINYFEMPVDVRNDRLILEVHYYDPYNFTINSNSTVYTWGNAASGSEAWANEAYADGQFQKMKTNFVDNHCAVIIGEYGVMARLNLGSSDLNATHALYRQYYTKYITHSIVAHGLVPFIWDSGFTGDNSMGLFYRSTGNPAYPEIIEAIIDTSNVISPVTITTAEEDALKLYPNPAGELFKLELTDQHINYLQLYDSCGRRIKIFQTKQTGNAYDISELSPGFYFIKVSTTVGSITHKLIKV
jgi:endoglucanase